MERGVWVREPNPRVWRICIDEAPAGGNDAPRDAAGRYNQLMSKPEEAFATDPDFLFEIDPEPAEETLTSWGGEQARMC